MHTDKPTFDGNVRRGRKQTVSFFLQNCNTFTVKMKQCRRYFVIKTRIYGYEFANPGIFNTQLHLQSFGRRYNLAGLGLTGPRDLSEFNDTFPFVETEF